VVGGQLGMVLARDGWHACVVEWVNYILDGARGLGVVICRLSFFVRALETMAVFRIKNEPRPVAVCNKCS